MMPIIRRLSLQSILLYSLLLLCWLPNSQSFQVLQEQGGKVPTTIRSYCTTSLLQLGLASSSNNASNNDDIDTKTSKPKGVYVRPSAVIEKGSGFFFPGLEGPRVRLVVGSGLLVATALNHVFSTSTSAFSEGLGVFYSLLVLLQGAIESSKEGRIESIAGRSEASSSSSSENTAQLSQQWSTTQETIDSSFKDRVEWVAASYLSLTPATHMILIQKDTIQYWLGVTPANTKTKQEACLAALTTIQQSKGGRVALPSNHPAAQGILQEETYRRCVVLQRINSDMCWMVASNDLLASFTKQDLQWLGRLATYVNQEQQQQEP